MSTSNLRPLELLVSHTSDADWSESTRHNSQSSSGSNHTVSHGTNQLRQRQPWLPAATKLKDTDSEYHYYLGDIYVRNKTPGDLVLSTQAEQEWVILTQSDVAFVDEAIAIGRPPGRIMNISEEYVQDGTI